MNQKKDIKKIIKQVEKDENFEILPSGKLRCKLTNHEMLPVQFEEFISGKSYKRALEKNFDASVYLPHLVQHKKQEDSLYCKLTGQKLEKKKTVLEKHIHGKNYQAKLKAFLEEEEKRKQAKLNRKSRNIDSNEDEGDEDDADDDGFKIDQMIAGFEKGERNAKKSKILAKVAQKKGNKKVDDDEDDIQNEDEGNESDEDDEEEELEGDEDDEDDEMDLEDEALEGEGDSDEDSEEEAELVQEKYNKKAGNAKIGEKSKATTGFKIDGKNRKPNKAKKGKKNDTGEDDEGEEEIEFIQKKVTQSVSNQSKKIKKVVQKLGKKPQPKEI